MSSIERIKKFVISPLCMLAMLLLAQPAYAKSDHHSEKESDSKSTAITHVITDSVAIHAKVSGLDKHDHIKIKLGDTELVLLNVYATGFDAYLPVGLSSGEYRLTIFSSEHDKDKEIASYDLTVGAAGPIGATGPQGDVGLTGPAGSVGPQGPIGLTGAKGDTGAVGPQGPVGLTGAKGDTGAVGPQGPIGANGVIGPMGPQGPVGMTGADGVVGPMGPQGPIGLTGAKGATGADGAVGPQGPIGLTGAKGDIGLTGAKGDTGAVGPQGPIGLTGAKGDTGLTGATGPQGPIGLTGADGAVGPQGPIGLTGAKGDTGLTGATGPQGPIGLTGAKGDIGLTGAKGDAGAVGPQGPIGLTGAKGDTGLTGATGPQGPIGLTGANGAVGPQGPIGLTGPAGADGINGTNGVDGAVGPQGPIGLTGPAGADGINGTNGIDGAVGPQGPIGLTGATGPRGPKGVAGPQGLIGLTGAAGPQGPIGLTGATGPRGPKGAAGPMGLTGPAGADSTVPGPQGPIGPQGPVGSGVWALNGTDAGFMGNVGIGVLNPAAALDIYGPSGNQVQVHATAGQANVAVFGAGQTGGVSIRQTTSGIGYLSNNDNAPLLFMTNAIEAMRVSELGKVGIGAKNPASQLHVQGTPDPGTDLLANHVMTIRNTSTAQAQSGLAIQLGLKTASKKTSSEQHFATFYDGGGRIVGRVDGQRLSDFNTLTTDANTMLGNANPLDFIKVNLSFKPNFISMPTPGNFTMPNINWSQAKINWGTIGSMESYITNNFSPAAATITSPVKFGTNGNFKDILAFDAAKVTTLANKAGIATKYWDIVKDPVNTAMKAAKLSLTQGVTYESAAGDYAEWLERKDHEETFAPTDIVGVFGGKISKNTKGADHIMVVSYKPVVLGNMQDKEQQAKYEKVAFIGQTLVKVRGLVQKGDYILPSGLDDGTGIAVSPDNIEADQFEQVLGVAWTDEVGLGEEVNLINVAVGLKPSEVATVVKKQQVALRDLSRKNDRLMAELETMRTQVAEISSLKASVAMQQQKMEKLSSRFEMLVRAEAAGKMAMADDGHAVK